MPDYQKIVCTAPTELAWGEQMARRVAELQEELATTQKCWAASETARNESVAELEAEVARLRGVLDNLPEGLHTAWRRYFDLLGEVPHGTQKQLAALMELVPGWRDALAERALAPGKEAK